jgi:hypothetical protein
MEMSNKLADEYQKEWENDLFYGIKLSDNIGPPSKLQTDTFIRSIWGH